MDDLDDVDVRHLRRAFELAREARAAHEGFMGPAGTTRPRQPAIALAGLTTRLQEEQ